MREPGKSDYFMIILALQIIVYSMTDSSTCILRLHRKDKVTLKVRALTHFPQAPLQIRIGSINRVKMVSLK